jgi:hypothetical protein
MPGGGTPSLQADGQGKIHVTWLEAEGSRNQTIHYAVFDPERGVLSRPAQMSLVFLRTGQSLDALTMALDDEYGYVFWSITDLRDGISWAEYVSFPLNDPSSLARSELRLGGLEYIRDPFFLDGQRSRAFVAVSGVVSSLGPGSQIALAIFRQGQFMGHQVVTSSGDASLKPALLADGMGELHLVWIDTVAFNRYRVLYASTTDQAKQALNVLTLWDVADTLVGAAMSLMLVVLFVPLVFAWSLIPAILILGYYFVTGDEALGSPRSWAVFASSVFLQIVGMIIRPPGFSAAFGRFVLPVLLAALAFIPAYVYLRTRRQRSILIAFAIFTLTHGLLRLIFYALSTVG